MWIFGHTRDQRLHGHQIIEGINAEPNFRGILAIGEVRNGDLLFMCVEPRCDVFAVTRFPHGRISRFKGCAINDFDRLALGKTAWMNICSDITRAGFKETYRIIDNGGI